jgi:hypothetical protein
MTINDLPAIMGKVRIVAGFALVGIYTRFRAEGSERSVLAGALLIVVGAVLLGLSIFIHPAQNRTTACPASTVALTHATMRAGEPALAARTLASRA